MADHKIKVSADVKEVQKSFTQLANNVKDIGKSKISLFEQSDKRFISRELKGHLEGLKKQLTQNQDAVKKIVKEMQDQEKSLEEQIKLRKQLNEKMEDSVKLQKDINSISSAAGNMGVGGILGRVGGMLPGRLGRLLSGGAGALGGIGLLAGGAMLGRARGAFNTFEQGTEDRLLLRGRGQTDMDLRDRDRATRAGLNAQSMRRARLGAMDIFGEAGATQQAVIQRAEFERNFGVQQGTLAGLGQQMRGPLSGAQAEKSVMKIQASLIASGITDEIGPFLETAAEMLTNLNEKGITFESSALATLTALTNQGISQERAGRMVSNLDQAIRGGTGETMALMQQVYGEAGLGGVSNLGMRQAVQAGGLFGLDASRVQGVDPAARARFESMGFDQDSGSRIAGGLLRTLDRVAGGNPAELMQMGEGQRNAGIARRSKFISSMFGVEGPVETAQVYNLLKQAAEGTDEEKKRARQELKDIKSGNTELGNLKSINDSTAASVEELRNLQTTVKDELGGKVAPAFVALESTFTKLDKTMDAMLKYFGVESETMTKEEIAMERTAKEGRFNALMSKENLSPDEQLELRTLRKDEKLGLSPGDLEKSRLKAKGITNPATPDGSFLGDMRDAFAGMFGGSGNMTNEEAAKQLVQATQNMAKGQRELNRATTKMGGAKARTPRTE